MPEEKAATTSPLWTRILTYVLITSISLGGLVTFLGFLGGLDWRLDLMSHFRQQYVVAFFFLLITSFLLKARNLILAAGLFFCINLLLFLPFYSNAKPLSSDTGILTFMANVNRDNPHRDLLLAEIKSVNPDVVILTEINASWITTLKTIAPQYPYIIQEPREDYSGIALMSKRPLKNPQIVRIGSPTVPSVVTEIEHNEKLVTLIGAHPFPPFGKRSSALRDTQIAALGNYMMNKTTPSILIGDLNASPFSYPYMKLLSDTTLSNCANGFGYEATWQYGIVTPPLGLKIDQCLKTPEILITESYVGHNIGSDHRPLINRFTF